MAGQNAHDRLLGRDHLLVQQLPQSRHARGAGRLAAEAPAGDHRPVLLDLLVAHLPHHAVHRRQRPQRLGQIHRPADLDGAGDRVRIIVRLVHRGVQLLRDRPVVAPFVPPQVAPRVQLAQRVGAAGVDHREPRHLLHQPQLAQLSIRLAKSGTVPEVAAGDDDPVGRLPVQRLEHPVHDALLPLQPEGVDAVHQVNAELRHVDRDLADAAQAGIEVSLDLERQRAVVQGLRQLAEGDFSRPDKHDPVHLHQRGEHGQARAGVAGGGAGDLLRPHHPGVGEGRRHAVVLEAAAGVEPLVLEQELSRLHAHLPGEEVGVLEVGAALADGDDVGFGAEERHQLAEPPHTGKVEHALHAGALGAPAVLEEAKAFRERQAVPVVADVEQAAAPGAGDLHVADRVSGRARGVDALLESPVGHRR